MPDDHDRPGSNPLEDLVSRLFGGLEESLGGLGGLGDLGSMTGQDRSTSTSTRRVDRHSRDLTAAARDGSLDPVVGRQDEIDQVLEVLSRRTKNNPVLIGEPGVGKTAIVEGLAQRIVSGDVPDSLRDRRFLHGRRQHAQADAGPR